MTADRRVLIVEDEVLIGLVLEDMLDACNCSVAANATTLADARAAVAAGGFDVAIIDVNIGADPVFPLADDIAAAGIPLVFATGAARESLPERFAGCEVLEKPYALATVETVLERVFQTPSS